MPDKELLVTSSLHQDLKSQAEVPATGKAKLPMFPSYHLELRAHSPCSECHLDSLTALARTWSQAKSPAWTAIDGASATPGQNLSLDCSKTKPGRQEG